jgi:hypothetical protein
VQVCFGSVEGPDIVLTPEFEELCPGQRPSSYDAEIGIGFGDGKIHFTEDIFGYPHCLLFVQTYRADLLNCFIPVRFCTACEKKTTD